MRREMAAQAILESDLLETVVEDMKGTAYSCFLAGENDAELRTAQADALAVERVAMLITNKCSELVRDRDVD